MLSSSALPADSGITLLLITIACCTVGDEIDLVSSVSVKIQNNKNNLNNLLTQAYQILLKVFCIELSLIRFHVDGSIVWP